MSSPSPQFENILPSGADTVLTISGLGGFQYQARGLSQTLSLIKEVEPERTINGKLINLGNPCFRKYSSRIICTDINAPPFDGLFRGMTVTVDCAAVLCYRTGNPGSPFRTPAGAGWTLGDMTFYHPTLEMMIMDLTENFEEWKCDFQWEMQLEEI